MANPLQPGGGRPTEQYSQLKAERDRALESAAKWRRFYEVEAQQRRSEAELAEKTIQGLRAELFQLCQLGPAVRAIPLKYDENRVSARLKAEVAELQQECDQLANALAQEQQRHSKTRENLITALGDVLQGRK
jgi:hypothetical protein